MASTIKGQEYLTAGELAERWGYRTQTLANLRNEGKGPTYYKNIAPGVRVGYLLTDVIEYEDSLIEKGKVE